MAVFAYSFDTKKEKLGLAQAHDVNASYKDLTQVCAAIKGKTSSRAKKILEDAIEGEKAIPFKKFNTGMGHRSELGGLKGKYPKKECRIVLALVKNAEANAGGKGLDATKLVVKFAAAYKQNTFPRYRKYWASGMTLGYGKQAIWANYQTSRVELALAQFGQTQSTAAEKAGSSKANEKPSGKKDTAAATNEQKKPKKEQGSASPKKETAPDAKKMQASEAKTDANPIKKEVEKNTAKELTVV